MSQLGLTLQVNKNINVKQTNEQIYKDNINDALTETVVEDLEWEPSVHNLEI